MKTWEYTTKQGDTWDTIARDVYGTESLAGHIQQANPERLEYAVFPSGIKLAIPETPASATAVEGAPWKRGGLLANLPNPVGRILLDHGLLIPPESGSGGGTTGDHTHTVEQVYEGDIPLSSSLRNIRGQLNAKLDKSEVDARYARKTHADRHAIGGDDRLAPADIGAVALPPNNGKSYLVTGSGLVEHVDGGNGGGTTDHSMLQNRDAPDQHPQSAIQSLESDLRKIRSDIGAVDRKVRGAVEELGGKVDVGTMDAALAGKAGHDELDIALRGKASKTHAADHHTGGRDALSASDIGALAPPTTAGKKYLVTSTGYEEYVPAPGNGGGGNGEKGEKGDPGPKGDRGEKGEKGAKGDPGPKGAKGDPGAKGDRGEKGEKGAKGDPGAKGNPGVKGDRGEKGDPGVKGAKGDTGPKGDRGEKGEKGAKGDPGVKGAKGDTGPKGDRGEKGAKGDTGAKGAKGDTGTVSDVIVHTVTAITYDGLSGIFSLTIPTLKAPYPATGFTIAINSLPNDFAQGNLFRIGTQNFFLYYPNMEPLGNKALAAGGGGLFRMDVGRSSGFFSSGGGGGGGSGGIGNMNIWTRDNPPPSGAKGVDIPAGADILKAVVDSELVINAFGYNYRDKMEIAAQSGGSSGARLQWPVIGCLLNGSVMVTGGHNAAKTSWVLSSGASTYTAGPALATGRHGAGGATLQNGTHVVAGGIAKANSPTKTTETLASGASAFTAGSAMTKSRTGFGMCTQQGFGRSNVIQVAGGKDAATGYFTECERRAAGGSWSASTALPAARGNTAMSEASIDSALFFIMGGGTDYLGTTSTTCYRGTGTGAWTPVEFTDSAVTFPPSSGGALGGDGHMYFAHGSMAQNFVFRTDGEEQFTRMRPAPDDVSAAHSITSGIAKGADNTLWTFVWSKSASRQYLLKWVIEPARSIYPDGYLLLRTTIDESVSPTTLTNNDNLLLSIRIRDIHQVKNGVDVSMGYNNLG